MSIHHSSADFKKLIDIMMPDTSLFDGKNDPQTNLYKWHVALALCLLEINNVVRQGFLDYFIDTASPEALRLIANELKIPDDIFVYSDDIEVLRKSVKAKSRIVNGVVTEDDLKDIAKMFGIENIVILHGDDGAFINNWVFRVGPNNSDLGLPLYKAGDSSHAFIKIYMPSDLIVNNVKSEYAQRFETLVQRIKSSYAYITFIYNL